MKVASCRWVRPTFCKPLPFSCNFSKDLIRPSNAGITRFVISKYPQICIAVGNVSFVLWPRFTSSLGWSGLDSSNCLARWAITSFTFMLVCVPEPVWNTVNGNSSSHLPSTISSTTWAMSFAFSSVTAPHFALVKAHAFLTSASALICSIGMRWSPILKLLNERCVWGP